MEKWERFDKYGLFQALISTRSRRVMCGGKTHNLDDYMYSTHTECIYELSVALETQMKWYSKCDRFAIDFICVIRYGLAILTEIRT